MLNRSILMGRLTRDPELRRTASGIPCCNFSLAVERDIPDKITGARETDFLDCVAWQKSAEFLEKYFRKGDMTIVSGRLQVRSWQDKAGNRRKTTELVADSVYFGQAKSQGTAQPAAPAPSDLPVSGDFAMLEDEDTQLPF